MQELLFFVVINAKACEGAVSLKGMFSEALIFKVCSSQRTICSTWNISIGLNLECF